MSENAKAEAMGEVQNARFQMVVAARRYARLLVESDEALRHRDAARAQEASDAGLPERLRAIDAFDDAALHFARVVEKHRAFEGVPAWLRALPERER